MTNANAQVVIATLTHKSGATVTLTGDMTKAAMLAAIKETGNPLGGTSLHELMNEKKSEAGGWTIAKPAATAEQPKAEEMQATAAPDAQPENKAPVQLTPEQQALADKVEAEMPTRDNQKPSLRGTDWKGVLPESPIPVKRNSKVHQLLVALCRPEGVTKKQLMDEFGWSAGGLSGVLHWEPKAKGYMLRSEKKDGEQRYHLCYHLSYKGGAEPTRVQPEEILIHEGGSAAPKTDLAAKIKELKKARGIPVPEAAPKAPKEPKVKAAAAENADKAPKVSKEQRAAAAPLAGAAANVTSRRRQKPAQA